MCAFRHGGALGPFAARQRRKQGLVYDGLRKQEILDAGVALALQLHSTEIPEVGFATVPGQDDGWSCGHRILLHLSSALKHFKVNGQAPANAPAAELSAEATNGWANGVLDEARAMDDGTDEDEAVEDDGGWGGLTWVTGPHYAICLCNLCNVFVGGCGTGLKRELGTVSVRFFSYLFELFLISRC